MDERDVGLSDLLAWGERLRRREGTESLADELLRVRVRSGKLEPLRANAAQRLFERRRSDGNIVLKARQMGVTTWVAGQFFLKTITQPGTLTVQVAQTREAAEGIFRMVQRMWENLPEPLRTGPLKRKRSNVGQMSFPELDSEFRVLSASDENAGRGLTIQNLHCSEVSRWPGDAAATLAGLRAALAPGGEICLESTPNGAYGCFYEEWMRGADESDEQGLQRHFFPWWLEPAYVTKAVTNLRVDELALMEEHGLTAQQIGFRRGLETSYRGLRAQEFAEDAVSCFKASGDCYFDVAAIEARLTTVPEPTDQKQGGALLMWLRPEPGKRYIVAVDTAGGGAEGDYAAIQVIERTKGLQCAELRKRMSVAETAKQAAALARVYGDALLAVERNNHGSGVIELLKALERYPNLYEQSGQVGWLTSALSKPGMIAMLAQLLVETPEVFYSRRLLAECRTYVASAGGKTGAAHGSHDDCLMAMAVGHAVRGAAQSSGSVPH